MSSGLATSLSVEPFYQPLKWNKKNKQKQTNDSTPPPKKTTLENEDNLGLKVLESHKN